MSYVASHDIEVDLAHGQEELSELLAAALVLEGSEEVRLRIGTMLGSPSVCCVARTRRPLPTREGEHTLRGTDGGTYTTG